MFPVKHYERRDKLHKGMMKTLATNKKVTAVAAIALTLAAAAGGVFWYQQKNRQEAPITDIEQEITEITEPPTTEPIKGMSLEGAAIGDEPGMTGKAKVLLQKNADTVGWITIPGTKVDNPIVQSDDDEFYLDMGYDHKPYRAGTVFLDFRDRFGDDEAAQSDNQILYGHNMANNEMFGSLRRYRQDYSYWKTAPFIELESNYRSYTYVIFGLVITDGSANATWRYWNMEDFATEDEFNAFVEIVKQKNLTTIPVDVRPGDKLLTLSTCYSDADDSRFLVIARRVRPDENADTFKALFAE